MIVGQPMSYDEVAEVRKMKATIKELREALLMMADEFLCNGGFYSKENADKCRAIARRAE